MEPKDKPKTYEAVPASLISPMAPIPTKGELPDSPKSPKKDGESAGSKPVRIQGLTSLVGSVKEAERKAKELLTECRRCVDRRDFAAFLDVLDAYPFFVEEPWVRETLHKLATQKRLHRKRGRRTGSFALHPLWVVGLVTQFIQSGEAENPEQALQRLADLDVMSYESAKDSYYRALRDTRFRPILLQSPELARRLTAEESAAVNRLPTLKPGTSLTTTATSADGERIKVTFTAKPE